MFVPFTENVMPVGVIAVVLVKVSVCEALTAVTAGTGVRLVPGSMVMVLPL